MKSKRTELLGREDANYIEEQLETPQWYIPSLDMGVGTE